MRILDVALDMLHMLSRFSAPPPRQLPAPSTAHLQNRVQELISQNDKLQQVNTELKKRLQQLDAEQELKRRKLQLHDEYRRKVWEDSNSGSENFDKYLLTFSSGALALSLTFLKDVVPLKDALWRPVLSAHGEHSSSAFWSL